MRIDEARTRRDEAYAAYQAVLATKNLTPPPALLPPPNFAGKFSASVENVIRRIFGLTPNQAEKCVKATIECIYKLSQASGDPDEIFAYANDLVDLTNELTAITEKQWATSNYEPVTANIKAAKDRLTKVKKKADNLASSLNIAADLLSGFGKFVAVLK